jgi:uncharacterized protein
MALVVPLKFATPLMSLCAGTVGLALLVLDWGRVDVRLAWRLVVGGVCGLPVGIALLSFGSQAVLRIVLGSVLLAFCLYETFVRIPDRVRGLSGLPYGCGFLAGVCGGAFTMPGPAIVAYGRIRDWPGDRFRATITGFAVPFGLTMLVSHGLSGFWTPALFRAYAVALPALGLGMFAGNTVHRRVPTETFRRLIRVGLFATGLMLVWQGVGDVNAPTPRTVVTPDSR